MTHTIGQIYMVMVVIGMKSMTALAVPAAAFTTRGSWVWRMTTAVTVEGGVKPTILQSLQRFQGLLRSLLRALLQSLQRFQGLLQ